MRRHDQASHGAFPSSCTQCREKKCDRRAKVQGGRLSLLRHRRRKTRHWYGLCLLDEDCAGGRRTPDGIAFAAQSPMTLPMNHDSYSNDYISGILRSVKTIAVVGASANDVRPSFFVMKYLIDKGYRIIPVNPGQAGKAILGQRVLRRLADIPEPIDMVDIFRASSTPFRRSSTRRLRSAAAGGHLDATRHPQRRSGGEGRSRRASRWS